MGTVSIFVCLHVGRGCVYLFACMRVGMFACVYGCLFVYVYVSGRALDSTSLIISVDPHPTTMPCRWRMPPVRWWFLAPGQFGMFGARIFSMPASCLAGWGCCSPHTLLNIYMEEPYEHKRDHTHRCTLKHSHWCKNRCSQTHIVFICCCFKTYFVILVRCAAQ